MNSADYFQGFVLVSSSVSSVNACIASVPQASWHGMKALQTAGLCSYCVHRSFTSKFTQRVPAGLPFGMFGNALEMCGAIQQAPQGS